MKTKLILGTLLSSLFFSQQLSAQFIGTSPGGSNIQYNNNSVGIKLPTSVAPSQDLDVGNNISIRGTHLVYNSANAVLDWGSGSTGDLYFRTLTTQGNLVSYTDKMIIKNNGNVGIGTDSPGYKLQIYDPANAHANIWTNSNNPAKVSLTNNWLTYYFASDSAIGRIGVTGLNAASVVTDFDLLNVRQTNGAPQVWVGYEKPVGANSDFNFGVAGKLVAQSIYVTASGVPNWADYVFAGDYKLPKLADVEKFYKANKHLPEIPTAKEVADKGIDVGQMNTLLLKKVEELTLYMVEQQKEIELLKKQK